MPSLLPRTPEVTFWVLHYSYVKPVMPQAVKGRHNVLSTKYVFFTHLEEEMDLCVMAVLVQKNPYPILN